MRIQVFSKYSELARAGQAKPLACPMHTEEEAVFPLSHRMSDDKIILECLACNYKVTAGLTLYNNLVRKILGFDTPTY